LIRHKTIAFFAAAFFVASARARPTNTAVITMDLPCARDASNVITVTLAVGQNTTRFEAVRADAFKPWVGTSDSTFPSDRAEANVRFKGRRTASQQSLAGKDEDAARFVFRCNQQPVQDLQITTDGPVEVSWLRKCSRCIKERGSFDGGANPYTVDNLWVQGEELRVSFFNTDPQYGLLVFSADTKGHDQPVFSLDAHSRARVSSVLEPEDIESALIKQGTSANTGLLEKKRLQGAGVKTLTLKVQ
jgi:hypothetical protein